MKALVTALTVVCITIGLAVMVKLVWSNSFNILFLKIKKIVRPTRYLCPRHSTMLTKGIVLICEKRCDACTAMIK